MPYNNSFGMNHSKLVKTTKRGKPATLRNIENEIHRSHNQDFWSDDKEDFMDNSYKTDNRLHNNDVVNNYQHNPNFGMNQMPHRFQNIPSIHNKENVCLMQRDMKNNIIDAGYNANSNPNMRFQGLDNNKNIPFNNENNALTNYNPRQINQNTMQNPNAIRNPIQPYGNHPHRSHVNTHSEVIILDSEPNTNNLTDYSRTFQQHNKYDSFSNRSPIERNQLTFGNRASINIRPNDYSSNIENPNRFQPTPPFQNINRSRFEIQNSHISQTRPIIPSNNFNQLQNPTSFNPNFNNPRYQPSPIVNFPLNSPGFAMDWSNTMEAPNDEDDDCSESSSESDSDDVLLIRRDYVEEDKIANKYHSNRHSYVSKQNINNDYSGNKPKRTYKKRKYEDEDPDWKERKEFTDEGSKSETNSFYKDENGFLVKKRKKYKPREKYHMVNGVLVKKIWGRPPKKKKENEVNIESNSESKNTFSRAKSQNIQTENNKNSEKFESYQENKDDWGKVKKKAFEELIGVQNDKENATNDESSEKVDTSRKSSAGNQFEACNTTNIVNEIIQNDDPAKPEDTSTTSEKIDNESNTKVEKLEVKSENEDRNISNNHDTFQLVTEGVNEEDLFKIQDKLANLTDPEMLRKVVNIIDANGSYNVEASSLDIDLYTLSADIVNNLLVTLDLK